MRKCDSNFVHSNSPRIKHHNSLKHCVISSLTSGKQKGVDSLFAAKMWLYFIFILFNFGYIRTFNVDTKSPILLEPNSRDDKGLFGHSISILDNDEGDAIVGAPASQIQGNVFRCRNRNCDKLGKFLISLLFNCNYRKVFITGRGHYSF